MKILKTSFKDLLIIKNRKFIDNRGYFREILVEKNLKKKFPFNVVSMSKKNVIRGLHYQKKKPQGKYVSVIQGKILDVVVDLRKNSKTFGKYVSIKISDKDDFSFYIPKGFAHGFVCLTKTCTINYKCSNYRDSRYERTLNWKDKKINIIGTSNSMISDGGLFSFAFISISSSSEIRGEEPGLNKAPVFFTLSSAALIGPKSGINPTQIKNVNINKNIG